MFHRFAAVLLGAALCATLLGCGGGSGTSSAPETRPPAPTGKLNVLLLITEDQGAQLGAYGTPGLATPHMDALAGRGALYHRAYMTMGSCTTSKASLMTGRYNHLIGVTANVQEFVGSYEELKELNPGWFQDKNSEYHRFAIPDSVSTLVEVLWSAGYYLGLQNKLHQSPHWKFPFDRWYELGSGSSYGQVSDFITHAKDAARPWFLVHSIGDPHRPWPDSSKVTLSVDPQQLQLPAHLPDTPTVRTDYAEYMHSVEIADGRVGQALQALQDSGEAARTLVVLVGDNGIGYHRGKYTTYQLGLQVPLIFSGPGITVGQVRMEPFSGVDFMPTLLELLQVRGPQKQDGVSHAALLTGADHAAPREYLLGNTNTDRSISDGNYQLIFMPDADDTYLPDDLRLAVPWRNTVYDHIVANADTPGFEMAYRLLDIADRNLPRHSRPEYELYDLKADPWELTDLASHPAYAQIRESMRAALCEQMIALGDSGARPAPCP